VQNWSFEQPQSLPLANWSYLSKNCSSLTANFCKPLYHWKWLLHQCTCVSPCVWLCTQISNQRQPAMTFGEYSKFKESERCDRFMPRKRSAKSHPEVTVSLCHFFPSYWWVNMSKCIGIWRRFRMYSWCWQYAWQSLPNQRGNWRYTDTSQTSINLVNQRGNWRSWRSGVCHKTPELYVSGPATVSQCCLMDWTACCDVYCGFVYTSACRTHKCEKIYISKMAQCKKWVFRISSIFLWCICDEYLVNTPLRVLLSTATTFWLSIIFHVIFL